MFNGNPNYDWLSYWQQRASTMYNDVVSQWLYPGLQQEKEWSQQMLATQYQNEWQSEEARMARGKAAGINPYTMAEGIAGSGGHGSVAGPPPSAVGSGANSLGAAANLAGQVVGAATGAAGVAETLGLLDVRKQLLSNQAFEALMAGGLSKWSALSISTLLPYQQWNHVADFYNKLANFDYVSQQIDNLKAEHDNIVARYDEIIANVGLKYSEMEVNEAIAAKTNEEARYWKATNDCWSQNGYDRNNPVDVALMNAKVNGNTSSAAAIGESVYQFHNQLKNGELDSLLEHQYALSSADAMARACATWFARSETLPGNLATIAYGLTENIKNGAETLESAVKKLVSDANFIKSYYAFRQQLKSEKNRLLSEYQVAKNSGDSKKITDSWRAYQSALQAYENCSKESYAEQLLQQKQ